MLYSFELLKHANIRYRDALPSLARCELFAMLFALDISTEIVQETMGGSRFLTINCRELSGQELSFLFGHSSIVFMAEKENGMLRPLSVNSGEYFPDDLPEVLKYKGKTNASFTRMMINAAVSLSRFRCHSDPLTLFDPICGKGTSCFCALAAGMNAVGLDLDRKDIREASDYFSRYLKFHKLKHVQENLSETFSGKSLPVTVFRFSDTKDHYQQGNTRCLKLAYADTAESPAFFRKEKAHIIVADLPYGVQHAPQSGSSSESLKHFLLRVLPSWKQVLYPGGAMAISFNTLTLRSQDLRDILTLTGFKLPNNDHFSHLSHEVEHAVVRDVVFAVNSEEELVV